MPRVIPSPTKKKRKKKEQGLLGEMADWRPRAVMDRRSLEHLVLQGNKKARNLSKATGAVPKRLPLTKNGGV